MKYYRITKMVVEYVEGETEDEAFQVFCEAESKMEDSIDIEEVSKEWLDEKQIKYWGYNIWKLE